MVSRHRTCFQVGYWAFVLSLLLLSSGCFANKKFSVAAWHKATPKDRRLMTDDFLRSIHTTGMSFDEIKALLGEPDYPQSYLVYYVSNDPSPPEPLGFNFRDVMYVSLDNGVVDYMSVPNQIASQGGIAFDSALWKSSRPAGRAQLATSLRDSETLTNKSAGQVEGLLGKANEREVSYNLGINVVADVTLTFMLDENDQVLSAEVVEH